MALSQLGLNLKALNKSEAKEFDLSQGVKIERITNDRLAELGLKEGQVIRRINGVEINDIDDADKAMRKAATEGRIALEVLTDKGVTERYIFN